VYTQALDKNYLSPILAGLEIFYDLRVVSPAY
jgi:hypothetical protein